MFNKTMLNTVIAVTVALFLYDKILKDKLGV